ncbi:histidine kinase [Rheinheimera sp.]|uniref:sensor histidine kinase n=1 Tax=Rheinheimera sp. TaxID=1869214 RepID=UPI00307F2BB4
MSQYRQHCTQSIIAETTMKQAFKLKTLLPLLPVLLALCWSVWSLLQNEQQASWSRCAFLSGQLLVELSPLLLAQWLLSTLQQQVRLWLLWLVVMLLYPLLSITLRAENSVLLLDLSCWLIAFCGSFLYWLELWYQSKLSPASHPSWLQKLWSLDTAVILLLTGWALFLALLLGSHQDPLANQPVPMQVNLDRLLSYPFEFIGYLLQFGLIASLMYGYYWLNRYWLIRRLLALHGLLPFVLSSLCLLLLSYPLLASLLLYLPINSYEVTVLASGNHNVFDWYNFKFVLGIWLVSTPLILAFDRQQQEKNLAQIQHRQVQTELLLLQQQINPHFLFNTLNNLYALCLMQSADAPKLILRLADLLRYVVYQGNQRQVTLQQEISYLQDYLALQQLRVSHRTTLTLQLPEQAELYQLPPLLLIMLVENAYKHGVENNIAPSQLHIQLQLQNQHLQFICENTVPAQSNLTTTGIGLANLRRRLQLHYDQSFTLHSTPSEFGWCATLTIPLEGARC